LEEIERALSSPVALVLGDGAASGLAYKTNLFIASIYNVFTICESSFLFHSEI
jgi:hypothetical protein